MLDFPSSPTEGQVFAPGGGMSFVYQAPAWKQRRGTAETRNRIVNAAMQISQENINVAGSVGAGLATYWAADQWAAQKDTAGVQVFSAQRVQVSTPNGSQNRIRISVTTALVTLAAASLLCWQHALEGVYMADTGFGSGVAAEQLVLRFGFKGPAGTYTMALRSSDSGRSYLKNFTISAGQANTDTEQVLVIPGTIAGSWPVDTQAWGRIAVTLAVGSSLQGTDGLYNASGAMGTVQTSNGLASTSNVFELFDVGLYLDPDQTGVPPPWVMPDQAEEMRNCQRYWYRGYSLKGMVAASTVAGRTGMMHPVSMRASPAVAVNGALRLYDGIAAGAATINQPAVTTSMLEMNMASTGLTTGRWGATLIDADDTYLSCSARM